MKRLRLIAAILLLFAMTPVFHRNTAQSQYQPKAVFCAELSNNLCSLLPAYIGPDPRLKNNVGYPGLFGPLPNSFANDAQTPFDNMAWQMFVALNWAASAVKQPPSVGLTISGPRVFQNYKKVSALFGDSPVTARCSNPTNLPVFNIGSNGRGKPMPNNEEFFQASTNLPLIDINGNWTLYERRVNDAEEKYLLAPGGNAAQTLTTLAGQAAFTAANPGGAKFTASATTPIGTTGSIEIKTSWRIINPARGDDPSRYYTQNVMLAVPGDLVAGGQKICAAPVTLGLVGMHIIQRNPPDPNNRALLPQWIWATFEHVDNAPLAQLPCSVATGCPKGADWLNQASCGAAAPQMGVRYSYFDPKSSTSCTNNVPVPSSSPLPNYPWSAAQPYAKGGTAPGTALPQATRCWSIYPTTQTINTQWQSALAALKSVFKNYTLVGTQWGTAVELRSPGVPSNAVPGMLSNLTLETYIQNYTGTEPNLPGPGSCIGCHAFATLAAQPSPAPPPPQSDFSFLPFLAQPETARSRMKTPR